MVLAGKTLRRTVPQALTSGYLDTQHVAIWIHIQADARSQRHPTTEAERLQGTVVGDVGLGGAPGDGWGEVDDQRLSAG